MKRWLVVSTLLLSLALAGVAAAEAPVVAAIAGGPLLAESIKAPQALTVTLPGLNKGYVDDASLLNGFGCDGGNKSLALRWAGAPAGTKSFAVTIHDPDAPTGVGFFHWTIWNLPAAQSSLPQGASGDRSKVLAPAVEGHTDFGKQGYNGPCPPPGERHRYLVTVYALDVAKLEGADSSTTGALLRVLLSSHTLAWGRATAVYGMHLYGDSMEMP